MGAWIEKWWNLSIDYYHVNPIIFLSLYIPKSFIYWWTIFRIVGCLRRKETHKVPGLVLLNVTTNISPWVYIYICGDNLPWYYPLWFVAVIVFTFWFLRRNVKKKLAAPPSKEELELERDDD